MRTPDPKGARFATAQRKKQRGASLLELLISIALFMIIGGVAFALFNQQQNASMVVNGQTGLNLASRAAVSQLQMDVTNGGNGYYQSANIPSWPVGVTIVNTMSTAGTPCNSGMTYGPTCFDQLNVVVAANSTNYPPVHATDSTGAAGSTNCTIPSSGVGYAQAASGSTLAQTAAEFSSGDQLLLIRGTGTPQISTVVLTAAGIASGSAVELQFHPTDTYGLNTITPDPLDISACDGIYTESTNPTCNTLLNSGVGAPRFADSFCGSDWVIKLAPISYQVCAGPGSPTVPFDCDQSSTSPDIEDPKLIRTQAGVSTIVMDQIIGFRVGAYLFNSPVANTYQYLASQYTINSSSTTASDPYNFSLIRAVRVSIIGRTAPNYSLPYRNGFDGGPYQVQGTAVVINPRNMSMNDDGGLP